MLKTLDTVSRLRHMAIDQGRQDLAACIRAEMDAAEARRDAEAALLRERDVAASLDAGDAAVEAFAAWLPTGRRHLAAAQEATARAEAGTAVARARLATAMAAAEVVDRLRATRIAERDTLAQRREQAVLDEIGQRPR